MRVVVTAITLETVGAVSSILNEFPVEQEEIIQMSVSRAKKGGTLPSDAGGKSGVYPVVLFCRRDGVMRAPRILIGATGSGSGKTTITCALLEILKRQGKKYRHLSVDRIISIRCFTARYLESHRKSGYVFTGEKMTAELFMESAVNADISVMEGVMGLYDGLGGIRKEGSAYDLATVTDTPVILVIDAHGMGGAFFR